jgi:hypothetical protein
MRAILRQKPKNAKSQSSLLIPVCQKANRGKIWNMIEFLKFLALLRAASVLAFIEK